MPLRLKPLPQNAPAAPAADRQTYGDVAEELADLVGRRVVLQNQLSGLEFAELPDEERDRLVRQMNAMGEYAAVLRERVDAWPESAKAPLRKPDPDCYGDNYTMRMGPFKNLTKETR